MEKLTVSAVIIPVTQKFRFHQTEFIGEDREIQHVSVCPYIRLFSRKFNRLVPTHIPSPRGIMRGFHLNNFRKCFKDVHDSLIDLNPTVVYVIESNGKRVVNLPGGKAEFKSEFDDPNIAIVREIKEETGLDVNVEQDYQTVLRDMYNICLPTSLTEYSNGTYRISYIVLY